MINVLVTGGNGQLAKNLKDIDKNFQGLNLIYKSVEELDITKIEDLKASLSEVKVQYCINCAAYTAVDQAEKKQSAAYTINELAVANMADICNSLGIVLIHISTDFVFDGYKSYPYNEDDKTNPQGVYGWSKRKGEIAIIERMTDYFILRTSWLYSEHNSNFMKTMISLSKTRDELGVVDDQIGTPTYAKDLADLILKIISSKDKRYGMYHYSNEGVASWYDFAMAIFGETGKHIKLLPIKTKDYPTLAERPRFSILDKSKIKKTFNIEIPYWRNSLKQALINLDKIQK
ncbi:MAG: dTDP-4-dehydrorhamnose reductase [Bacteroidota bacterium]